MFRAHVIYLLWKYLGGYTFRIWKGLMILKNLRLEVEELSSLNFPTTVKAVFIDTITIQVPWKSAGKGTINVLIDHIFVLAEPAPDGHAVKDEDKEKHFERKFKWIKVIYLLWKYLGGYTFRVRKGLMILKNLRLEAEELSSLNLPITVKAVFIDTITIQVPWSAGKGTINVLIDHIFVLAEPAPDGHAVKDEDKEKLFKSKFKWIKALSESSWMDSLIATSIEGYKVTINNVHIRYEDSISNPGHPFCSGVTLSKLVAVTADELDNETFDTSGALNKLCESLQLLRLAVGHDTYSAPWKLDKSWEDLNSVDWTEIFQDGIDELYGNGTASLWAKDLRYLMLPINGALKYHTLGNLERLYFKKASLVLSDVYFTVSEAQYYWCIKLLEALSTYKTRMEVSHLRPDVPVFEDTHAWWRYAMLASLQQKKLRCWFSWERIKHMCELRRLYVQMYSTVLQQTSKVDIYAMRKIERVLDSEVILLWRWLAQGKLETVGEKKRSWLSFVWLLSTIISCTMLMIYLGLLLGYINDGWLYPDWR